MQDFIDALWRSAYSQVPLPLLTEAPGGMSLEFSQLKMVGLLRRLPALTRITCPGCGKHSEKVVDIHYQDGSMRFFVPCPVTGREEVLPERLLQWGVHFTLLPDILTRAFSLPKARCLAQDKLWHLGAYSVGLAGCDLWIGRWLDWQENASLFNLIPRSPRTILLYLGGAPDAGMLSGIPPTNILPASDIVQMDGLGLHVDKSRIDAVLYGEAYDHIAREMCMFRSEGDAWRIAYEGKTIIQKHNLGMNYLRHLLGHPGEFFMAANLRKLTHPDFHDAASEAGHEVTDRRSARQYMDRLRALPDEIDRAQVDNNVGKVSTLQTEQDALLLRLRSDLRLGGDIRLFVSETQKVHRSLAKALNRSLEKLQDKHIGLWRHLSNSIKIRNSFGYLPESPMRWVT